MGNNHGLCVPRHLDLYLYTVARPLPSPTDITVVHGTAADVAAASHLWGVCGVALPARYDVAQLPSRNAEKLSWRRAALPRKMEKADGRRGRSAHMERQRGDLIRSYPHYHLVDQI